MAVIRMLRRQVEKQQMMDPVIVEQMVPEDHLLRKADGAVDFSFIHDLCAPLSFAEILLSGRSSNSFSRESMIALRVLEINVETSLLSSIPALLYPKMEKMANASVFYCLSDLAVTIWASSPVCPIFGHKGGSVRFLCGAELL